MAFTSSLTRFVMWAPICNKNLKIFEVSCLLSPITLMLFLFAELVGESKCFPLGFFVINSFSKKLFTSNELHYIH